MKIHDKQIQQQLHTTHQQSYSSFSKHSAIQGRSVYPKGGLASSVTSPTHSQDGFNGKERKDVHFNLKIQTNYNVSSQERVRTSQVQKRSPIKIPGNLSSSQLNHRDSSPNISVSRLLRKRLVINLDSNQGSTNQLNQSESFHQNQHQQHKRNASGFYHATPKRITNKDSSNMLLPMYSSNNSSVIDNKLKESSNRSYMYFNQHRQSTEATQSMIGSQRDMFSQRNILKRRKQNSIVQESIEYHSSEARMFSKKNTLMKSRIFDMKKDQFGINNNSQERRSRAGSNSLSPKHQKSLSNILRPISKDLSPWTQCENLINNESLQYLDEKERKKEHKLLLGNLENANLGKQLLDQKDEIKRMMMETNQVVSSHHASNFNFVVEDPKKQSYVQVKIQPFIMYSGKVKVFCQQSPLRIETENDDYQLGMQLSLDDHTFSNIIAKFQNQYSIQLPFSQHNQYCYIKFNVDSHDLDLQPIKFRFLFGQPPKKKKNSISTQSTIQTQFDSINQEQPKRVGGQFKKKKLFKAKINQVLNDDSHQTVALKQMQDIFRTKREKLFSNKNFIDNNVEKAASWIREIIKVLQANIKVRKQVKDQKLRIRWYGKLLKWNIMRFVKFKGKKKEFRLKNTIRDSLIFVGNSKFPSIEEQAKTTIFVQQIQKIWQQQCTLRDKRKKELKKLFEDEKEKLIVHMIKNKVGPAGYVKKLKKLKDEQRDALIARYYLKCRIAHCDKFFEWRTQYLKLSLEQKIIIDSQIRDATLYDPDFNSMKVTSFKQIRLPQNLGLKQTESLAQFEKVLHQMYPDSFQQKRRQFKSKIGASDSGFFMTQQLLGQNENNDQNNGDRSELVENIRIMKYIPEPCIMALLVYKACNLKKEDYTYVF
ncbi:UNKNOWN [Stylonychia lemnae]|uniref:Uncharacterized protein n=1 Tax=Stylonychia lemnae TaxID=5949 RepID=A0A078AU43_STYLE|nr:UNKNOWN [Stylonychia lemnae]|eukprot:CDW85920.1 UNKNOWN [Stylonychia lemnae]